jgi:hypothetical protein
MEPTRRADEFETPTGAASPLTTVKRAQRRRQSLEGITKQALM